MSKPEIHDPSLEGIKGLKSIATKKPEDVAFDQYVQSNERQLSN